MTRGNIENFIGVAQVPIGLAGPVKVNGEYAKGEFVVKGGSWDDKPAFCRCAARPQFFPAPKSIRTCR